ncbi:MAG: putative transposase YbfD/YdcC [Gammaproteobacteria bacterium]|jgi:predicted transposase YbfD/YdcC
MSTAIPVLLELLALKGSIVAIYTMGTQRAIAQAIVDKGADYVSALKGNQGTLAEDVNVLFREPLPSGFEEQSSAEEIEAGHGRIESRRYRQIMRGRQFARE